MVNLISPGLLAACTLMLVLALPAFCQPAVRQPNRGEQSALRARHEFILPAGARPQVLAEVNKLVQTRPSWEAYYRRAVLRYVSKQYAGAAADCEQSLKMQKSQAAYDLLFAATIMEGPPLWPRALTAAVSMAKTNPEAFYPNENAAFVAALGGDFDRSVSQLAAYAAQAVPAGRGHQSGRDAGQVGQLTEGGLQKIVGALGESANQVARKQLLLALAAYFRHDCVRSQALLAAYDKAVDGQKPGPRGEGNLALALSICNDQGLNRSGPAEAKALKLVQQTGESTAALSLLDTTYFVLGQREKSLAFINHLIERESAGKGHPKPGRKLIDLLDTRAVLLEQMREIEPALRDCLTILKLDSTVKKTRLDVCRYKLMLGQTKGVLAELDKYIASYPGDGVACFLRAQVFVLDKNWRPASLDLSRAIDDGYYLIKALRARAACLQAMHQNSLASNDTDLAEKFRLDNIIVRNLPNGFFH